MDSVIVTVTPRIFSVLQRVMPGSGRGGGVEKANLPFFYVKIISSDIARLTGYWFLIMLLCVPVNHADCHFTVFITIKPVLTYMTFNNNHLTHIS